MKDADRFLNELFRIVNGALRLDIDKVRNYTAFLADNLEKEGDKTSATRLRKMLDETDHQLHPAKAAFEKVLPVDTDSRFALVERVNPAAIHEPRVILSQEQWDIVNEFLSVAKSYAQTDTDSMASSLSFLLCGPPGTGKSRLARFIAQELGLPLYVARLDGLISSFLGNTSKNIRAIFDFAAKTPCVLFLDEFDAIAKLRGDTQEMGELKRVVNSFIQNLDTLGRHSIVIAATNHSELLDTAVWRRFSYRIALDFPPPELRHEMWAEFIQPFKVTARELELLVDISEGFSGSDIQEVCVRLRRRNITTKHAPKLNDAFLILQNLAIGEGENRRFVATFKGKDSPAIATALNKRNTRLYSFAALGNLLGVSKASAYRWVKEADHNG
jgi:SpoVK/Ycf46/Vps4 family AAA+-type ATPase